jgi:hypothetical protein
MRRPGIPRVVASTVGVASRARSSATPLKGRTRLQASDVTFVVKLLALPSVTRNNRCSNGIRLGVPTSQRAEYERTRKRALQ